jgi:hypothetical protein
MGRPGDYGDQQGYQRQAGSGGYGPAVPPQFQQDAPPRQDGTRSYAQQGNWQQPQFQPPYQQPQYQPGYAQPPQYGPPQQQPPRKSRKGIAAIGCLGFGGLIVLIAALAGSHSSSSSSSAPAVQTQAAVPPVHSSAPAKAAAPKAPAAQTVTYEVTGSTANVTYGPAGSNSEGTVPMHVTKPLGTPIYYAITAQLQGGGTVTCKIEVDGKVISQSTASGGYNIAQCEISQDPLNGGWQNTMG